MTASFTGTSVQRAIRHRFIPPVEPRTLGQGKPFVLRRLDDDRVVLELGAQRAYTPLSWECLEGVADFLRERGAVRVGGRRNVDGEPGTLDEYLKKCIKRDTARWVASLLTLAGVLDIADDRPLTVRLSAAFRKPAGR